MRTTGPRMLALLATATLGGTARAASDRIMDVATMTFSLPAKLKPGCAAKIPAVTTEAEAAALLTACRIAFDRDHYSLLKSKTPPADWERALTGAPIGKVALRQNGSVSTYFIVRQERVLGMASLSEAFPIRRVIYEGTLDAPIQKELGPLHDIDAVIHVLTNHNIKFVQDSGTLLSSSVPEDVSGPLATLPAGDPIVVQGKDHGTIYARRITPKP